MAKKITKGQKEGKTREELVTEIMTCMPSVSAGFAIRAICGDSEMDIGDGVVINGYSALCIGGLITKQQRLLEKGDLSSLETMLLSQAYTLNAIMTSMTKKMANAEYVQNLEVYGRLALKAQSQVRQTISTLAEIKGINKTTFIHQTNNANNQQINNNGAGENSSNPANEKGSNDVDSRSKAGGARADSKDKAVVALERDENAGGACTFSTECNEARHEVKEVDNVGKTAGSICEAGT